MKKKDTTDGLMGLSIGDALGLPVKNRTREYLEDESITNLIGYGTYNQPPGTWSEESSLAFCLVESLEQGYNPGDLANRYCRWFYEAYWTPSGKTFDIHPPVEEAIHRIHSGTDPLDAGSDEEMSPGVVFSLLPLAYYLDSRQITDYHFLIMDLVSIIHKHPVMKVGAVIYIQYALNLINGEGLTRALENACRRVEGFLGHTEYEPALKTFRTLWNIPPLEEIINDGEIVSLFALGFRCLLNNHSYRDTVLQAVNLGGQTDSLGAMTGGLAGIYYGLENIPPNWIEHLIRFDDIEELAREYNKALIPGDDK